MFFKKVTIISVFILSAMTIISVAIAAPTEAEKTPFQQKLDQSFACDNATKVLIADLLNEFYEQIDDFMNSASLPSSQIAELEESRYMLVSKVMAFKSNQLDSVNLDIIFKREGTNQCNNLIDSVVDNVNVVYNSAVTKTLQTKSALMIVDKYDKINLQLRKLIDDVNSITGQVKTFDNQVPCFIDRCLF